MAAALALTLAAAAAAQRDAPVKPDPARPRAIGQALKRTVDAGAAPAAAAAPEAAAATNTARVSSFLPNISISDPSVLPCTRPQPHSGAPQLTDLPASAWSVTRSNDTGAWRLRVTQAISAAVTGEMIEWMWRNAPFPVKDPRDGKTYPLMMLIHPVDHVHGTWSTPALQTLDGRAPKDVKNATRWAWAEAHSTGCTFTPAGDGGAIECPRSPPPAGLLCNSSAEDLSKVQMLMADLTYLDAVKPDFVRHITFYDTFRVRQYSLTVGPKSNKLVTVTQEMLLGDDELEYKRVNDFVLPSMYAYATNGSVFGAGLKELNHMYQEMAWLPEWLPKVWRANKKRVDDSAQWARKVCGIVTPAAP